MINIGANIVSLRTLVQNLGTRRKVKSKTLTFMRADILFTGNMNIVDFWDIMSRRVYR